MRWYTPVIPELMMWKQKDQKLKVILTHTACLKGEARLHEALSQVGEARHSQGDSSVSRSVFARLT